MELPSQLSNELSEQLPLLIVSNVEAADLLLETETTELLRPFMRKTLTIKEASESLGLSFMKAHYRIKKFVEIGLLEAVASFMHKGRERYRYRAVAKRFFVPFCKTQAYDLKSFLRKQDAQWYEPMLSSYVSSIEQSTLNPETFGISISIDENNLFKFSVGDNPEIDSQKMSATSDVSMMWDTSFYLSLEEMQQMQTELKNVLDKYRAKQNGQRYVVRFACVPWRT